MNRIDARPAEAIRGRPRCTVFDPTLPGFGTRHYVTGQGRAKEAAYDLSQAVERLYHCVLLFAMFYTPNVHNIGFLRTQADRLDPRLIKVWPRAARTDRARFEKLKAAYVKARYSASYSIAPDALERLTQRVAALAAAVQAMCAERITELTAAAQAEDDHPEA